MKNPAGSRFCAHCGQPLAAAPVQMPAAPPSGPVAGSRSPLAVLGVLGALLALVPVAWIWGLPRWLGGRTSSYEIRVRTSPATRFQGSYAVLAADGAYSLQSVEGAGFAMYPVGSQMIASAVFQKHEREGTLILELWRDGELLQQGSTSAEYGVVSLAGSADTQATQATPVGSAPPSFSGYPSDVNPNRVTRTIEIDQFGNVIPPEELGRRRREEAARAKRTEPEQPRFRTPERTEPEQPAPAQSDPEESPPSPAPPPSALAGSGSPDVPPLDFELTGKQARVGAKFPTAELLPCGHRRHGTDGAHVVPCDQGHRFLVSGGKVVPIPLDGGAGGAAPAAGTDSAPRLPLRARINDPGLSFGNSRYGDVVEIAWFNQRDAADWLRRGALVPVPDDTRLGH